MQVVGRIPSKKNSKVMICRGGVRPMILPQAKYKKWEKEASEQLISQCDVRGLESCKVSLTLYAPDKRKADLTNKAESIMDLLVDTGIIVDDNWFVCPEVNLIFGGVDREFPRVEIKIYENT